MPTCSSALHWEADILKAAKSNQEKPGESSSVGLFWGRNVLFTARAVLLGACGGLQAAGRTERRPGVPFCFIRSSIFAQNRIPISRSLWK